MFEKLVEYILRVLGVNAISMNRLGDVEGWTVETRLKKHSEVNRASIEYLRRWSDPEEGAERGGQKTAQREIKVSFQPGGGGEGDKMKIIDSHYLMRYSLLHENVATNTKWHGVLWVKISFIVEKAAPSEVYVYSEEDSIACYFLRQKSIHDKL